VIVELIISAFTPLDPNELINVANI
jgi:hypothetical protein